jgi:hypothetical protein
MVPGPGTSFPCHGSGPDQRHLREIASLRIRAPDFYFFQRTGQDGLRSGARRRGVRGGGGGGRGLVLRLGLGLGLKFQAVSSAKGSGAEVKVRVSVTHAQSETA